MDTLQLKYFVTVARHLHFTKAADELFISQPALSNAIRRLEVDLKAPLFIRTKTGVQLSEYGAMFLPVAQKVLEETETAQRKISEVQFHRQDSVRIIAPSGFIYSALMDKLLQTSHNVSFIIGNISPAEVDRSLKSGEAQFCIYGHDIKVSKMERLYLGHKPNYLTVYHTHPYANTGEIEFREMERFGIIALYRGTSPRKEYEDLCKAENIQPTIIAECSDIYSAMNHKMMLSGDGAIFGPIKPLKARIGDLRNYRFIKINGPMFTRVLYWNPIYANNSPICNEIKQIIIDYYLEENSPK